MTDATALVGSAILSRSTIVVTKAARCHQDCGTEHAGSAARVAEQLRRLRCAAAGDNRDASRAAGDK
jgi:hypothetical protein